MPPACHNPQSIDRVRPWLFVASADPVAPADIVPVVKKPSLSIEYKTKETPPLGSVNVNRATQEELQKLPGIGPKMSQRILDERAKGLFKSVEELRRVSGIGPKTLEKMRPYVTIEAK